ncbi:MAG: M48 family metallopeptidase [Pseudomonadales bacterium]
MTNLPDENPRIPEGINVKNENPFSEFLQLLAGVLIGSATVVLIIVLVIDLMAPYIPFSWEDKAAPLIAQYLEQGDSPPPAEAQQALADLGAKLVDASFALDASGAGLEKDGGVPKEGYHFHLVNSSVANAYATLGGHIIVTDALLKQVNSENGLAMVVAHEIAHIRYRHPVSGASRAVVLQLALYALLGGSGDGPLGGLLSGSSMLALLSFNRDMEAAADLRALDILNAHYQTYLGADEFFQTMANSKDEAFWLEFAQTHPNSERRLEKIRQRISSAADGDMAITPLPAALTWKAPLGQAQ